MKRRASAVVQLWNKFQTTLRDNLTPGYNTVSSVYHTNPQSHKKADLVAVRQEAALLDVSHKPPDRNVIQDEFEVEQLLNGLMELLYLTHTHKTFRDFSLLKS